ncbi:hypothetical protein F2P45_00100 [Massilia sp. CCM 8733]|uniref:Uncharacterized protein n=1 Tax=Massilia mucilaginosa TaxID=2609282 RepID=A0ABX0NKW7_9BURK|nr:hypothetical protein [Massilia mucilaginosa]NHZ87442.1 hypothetical protein [Massilia mucilaginosa]
MTGDTRLSPPIWNPGAAAAWCLVFGIMFGSWIHMKNWQVLGKPDKAAASKRWLIGSALLFLFSFTLAFAKPESLSGSLGRFNFIFSLAALVAWYVISAREQIRFVATTYGKNYQHRSWGTPLLYGLLVLVGVGVAGAIAGIIMAVVSRAA